METQIRLSGALWRQDRPHAAELQLAVACRTMTILSGMFPHHPRYHAAQANSYSRLAELLQATRPEEAQQACNVLRIVGILRRLRVPVWLILGAASTIPKAT